MNFSAAVAFFPPITAIREAAGLPEAHPLYLWILATWLPIFGVAYFRMGWTGIAERTFLAVGAAGKATFGLIVVGLCLAHELPTSAIGVALPDLILSVAFVDWLVRHRIGAHRTGRQA